jgi:hypothetical protein
MLGWVPQRETVRTARFYMDVAMIMYMRRLHRTPKMYFWQLDSSPQAGYDWLMSSYTAVAVESLEAVHDAWVQLARRNTAPVHMLARDGDSTDSDIEGGGDSVDEVAKWSTTLADCVEHHQQIPVALGLRAADITHKTHAWLWAMALEQDDLGMLAQMVKGCVSATTDMGTELGFADIGRFDVEHELRRAGLDHNVVLDDTGIGASSSAG